MRDQLEEGVVDGFGPYPAGPERGSSHVPLFVFHPAGGSTVVYEPLMKRLPADTPIYGIERVEAAIEERAARVRAQAVGDAQGPVRPGRLVAGRGAGLRSVRSD